jgi:hypothetical protein
MNAALPISIDQYLSQLRATLRDADPALVQDALYDAEEYLRGELAENPGESEAAVIARVASSYGAPAEVADIYRDTELRVVRALRSPPPVQRRGLLGRFFGVATDPRTWGALFYMLLSLATGIVYFTVVVTGLSLSAGLLILIIGIPFILLFLGLTRVLSLVEGRLVEVMLGERMPRRPRYADRDRNRPWLQRMGDMLRDGRTWSTMLYMVLMLPLGIVYFTVAVTALSVSLGLIAGAGAHLLWTLGVIDGRFGTMLEPQWLLSPLGIPLLLLAGTVLLFAFLHGARGIGRLHAAIAKQLLVKSAADD